MWRPVAAALAWLEEAGGDMKKRTVESNPDDFFLVLYLGADAIECVTFQMRVLQDRKGLDYIVPRRERPRTSHLSRRTTGRAGVLEQIPQARSGTGAFWQAFVSFPEVVGNVGGEKPTLEKLPGFGGSKWIRFLGSR